VQLRNQLTERKKEVDKYRDASRDAKAWISLQTDKYSQFGGGAGAPTHDAAGKELSKSVAKALAKSMSKQDALHKEYTEKLAKDSAFFTKLQAALAEVEAEIKKLES